MPDTSLYDVECVVASTLVVFLALSSLLRRLRRTRPEFAIGSAVGVGTGLRLAAAAGVSITGLGSTLRGGDEVVFVQGAHEVARASFDSGIWIPSEAHRLHEILFAVQIKLGDVPDAALRVVQVGVAMLGIVLVVAAIYDLAGPRAARVGAWVLVLEPSGIFFNSLLHREPLLVLASGLVVFGGSKIWAKLDLSGVALLGLGCAVATATRPYAGWFLITGGLLLTLHASLRQVGSRLRSVPLVYAVAIVVAITAPAVLHLTSQESLEKNLQAAQDANTNPYAPRGGSNSNNLSLERVDFSTRSDLLTNLPRRVRDVVLRPYPWQIQNTSQQLGAIGTIVVLVALYLLFRYTRSNWGRVLAVTAPVVYPACSLLCAYALSVGNAGTGFRYRTHLVMLGLAALVVLREHAMRGDASAIDGKAFAGRKESDGPLGRAHPTSPRGGVVVGRSAPAADRMSGRKPTAAATTGAIRT